MTDNNNNTVRQETETKTETKTEQKLDTKTELKIAQEILDKWSLVPAQYIKPETLEEHTEALEYLGAMHKKWLVNYKDRQDALSVQLNYVKLSNLIRKLKQDQAKIMDAIETENKAQGDTGDDLPETVQDTILRFLALINERNLHYIENDNVFFMQKDINSDTWRSTTPQVLQTGYGVCVNQLSAPHIADMLDAAGRKRDAVVCTFKKEHSNELNIMQKGEWLEPLDGKYHPILDVIFDSITDRNDENKRMVEEWLLYKRFKPEDHRLMAIVLFGEGKVGKTEFVETVLATMFGGVGVKALSAEQVFGQFNEEMLNSVIVLIDEFDRTASYKNNIKLLIGNSTFSYNKKNGIKGSFDNTAAYMIAANGDEALSLLNGTGTDMRYALVPVKRNIIIHAMIHLGYNVNHLIGKPPSECKAVDPNFAIAEKWYNNNLKFLSNEEHVAKWFGGLLLRHLDAWDFEGNFIMGKPVPLNTTLYKDAVEVNKPMEETFADKLFNHPHFRAIKRKECYRLYKEFVKEEGSNYQISKTADQKVFWRKLLAYIDNKGFDVQLYSTDNRVNMVDHDTEKQFSFTGIRNEKCEEYRKYIPLQYVKKVFDKMIPDVGRWFDDDYNEDCSSLKFALMKYSKNKSG